MKSILKLTAAASVAMLLATGCSQSDGSSNSQITPPANVPAKGKAIDGYIKGALIFADCNGNLAFDPDPAQGQLAEPNDITDTAGDYGLSIPDSCKFAQLIASGGVNIDSNLPFSGVLIASAGSTNISPLTTVAALNPAFAAELTAQGIDPSVDFTTQAIPADLLAISQQVVTAINITAFNTKVTDIATLIDLVVTPLAEAVDTSDENLSKTLATVATEAFVEIAALPESELVIDDKSAIASSITSTLVKIETEIVDNNLTTLDKTTSEKIAAEVIADNEKISAAIKIPVLTVKSFEIGTDGIVESQNNDYTATTTEAAIISTFTVDLNATDTNNTNYTINLVMAVRDAAPGLRSATFSINNIALTTSENDASFVIDLTQTLSASINGTDANGNPFIAVNLTDGTLGDILATTQYADGTKFILQMGELLNKVRNQAGQDHPLGDFFIPGSYAVTVTTTGGIPTEFTNYILDLTIN